jgi:hypothetical protein
MPDPHSHLRLVYRAGERSNGDVPNDLQRGEAPLISTRLQADRTTYALVFLVLLITFAWVAFLGCVLIKFAGLGFVMTDGRTS